MIRLIVPVAVAALTLTSAQPSAAQPADYRTFFTFSAPVTLPGVTLPAGTYQFRIANPQTSRKVINVLSEDGTKSLAMLASIPNRMPEAPSDPEVRFMETSSNMPAPIKTWWYPGNAIGYEFIYPREQALELMKVTNEPVLTTTTSTKDYQTADLARVRGAGEPIAVTPEQNPPAAPASGRVEHGRMPEATSAAAAPRPADARSPSQSPAAGDARVTQRDGRAFQNSGQSTRQAETTTARTELPQTASMLPLMTAAGTLMALVGAGLLRRRSSR